MRVVLRDGAIAFLITFALAMTVIYVLYRSLDKLARKEMAL